MELLKILHIGGNRRVFSRIEIIWVRVQVVGLIAHSPHLQRYKSYLITKIVQSS